MIPFESFDAMMLNNRIFKHIHDESLKASQWMAKEFGEPEWCKGYGVRNTHRTAIAPTMSTSMLMGGKSQGIEPIVMNVFTQTTSAGGVRRINPTLLRLMQERGVYNKTTLKDIEDNAGSVAHVNWLSDHEKDVFKTAFELNQKSLLQQARQRQKWICQGQSLNLFFDANDPKKSLRLASHERKRFLLL
jgi:ribonucleoside-diphosphate reductase alpha chain